jgi:hypothetical protein
MRDAFNRLIGLMYLKAGVFGTDHQVGEVAAGGRFCRGVYFALTING